MVHVLVEVVEASREVGVGVGVGVVAAAVGTRPIHSITSSILSFQS